MVMGKRCTAIAVLQRVKDNKILIGFCERNNGDSKVKESDTWKMPQGGMDEFESSWITIKREVKEELGYDLNENVIEIKGMEEVSYFFKDEQEIPKFEVKLHPFLIRGDFPDTFENVDKTEFTELKWVEPKEVINMKLGIRRIAYLVILRNFELI